VCSGPLYYCTFNYNSSAISVSSGGFRMMSLSVAHGALCRCGRAPDAFPSLSKSERRRLTTALHGNAARV
jgi:hypothetical protein